MAYPLLLAHGSNCSHRALVEYHHIDAYNTLEYNFFRVLNTVRSFSFIKRSSFKDPL
jgi:hypothetical protein